MEIEDSKLSFKNNIFTFKVKDYTTIIVGRYSKEGDFYYVQRGDNKTYRYDSERVQVISQLTFTDDTHKHKNVDEKLFSITLKGGEKVHGVQKVLHHSQITKDIILFYELNDNGKKLNIYQEYTSHMDMEQDLLNARISRGYLKHHNFVFKYK